jgi:Ca2+/Na+ antiporter
METSSSSADFDSSAVRFTTNNSMFLSSSSSSSCFAEQSHDETAIMVPMTASSLLALLDGLVDAYVTTLYTCIVFVYLFLQYRIKSKLQRAEKARVAKTAAAAKKQVPAISDAPPKDTINDELPTTDIGDFNLTGTYKMISNENMDAFLTIQGVPWALRRAASGVMPNHHITHKGNQLTIRIHAAGLLETTTSYIIHGPTVETIVRGRCFRDVVMYHRDPITQRVNGIQTEKTAVTEGYLVRVLRVLSEDRNTIYMTSSALFPNDPSKADVVSKQVFQRISETS